MLQPSLSYILLLNMTHPSLHLRLISFSLQTLSIFFYVNHYWEVFVQQFYLLLFKCLFDIFTCYDCTSSTLYFSASSDISSIADAMYILSSTGDMTILTSIGSIDDLSQCKIYSLDTCLLACQTQLTHLHFFQTADTILLILHSIQDTIISHFAIPRSRWLLYL